MGARKITWTIRYVGDHPDRKRRLAQADLFGRSDRLKNRQAVRRAVAAAYNKNQQTEKGEGEKSS